MDKYKDFEILLERNTLVKYGSGVMNMSEKDSELLNTVWLQCCKIFKSKRKNKDLKRVFVFVWNKGT